MYEKVFNLESRPFVSAPFVKHYYATQSMSHTLAQAQLCIERAAGPVVVIGGAGTGKSLLLTMLAEKYASQFNVVNLACARLAQRSDLLQNILFELEQPYRDMSEGELRLALIDFLKPTSLCPNGILLLVDEAQVLDGSLLDEVRLITNFVRDGQPRVRLIMAGSQELEDALTNPKLESFNQRIAARCYLSNLSYEETVGYVRTHIDRAGGRGEDLVPDNTIRVLFEVTDGCPRLINQVCDQALMLAAVNNQSLLTEQCLQEAWRDVQNIPGAWPSHDLADSAPNAPQESQSEQWTVLEFGQLEDESTEGETTAVEIATAQEQQQFAETNPVHADDSDQSATAVDNADSGAQSWDNVDEFSAPLVEQITEFAKRYGAAESLAAEDEIVDPLAEQIAEFQERYGAAAADEDPAAFLEAAEIHEDIAIPLEAQVAELNLRSQSVESSLGEQIFAVREVHDDNPDFVDLNSETLIDKTDQLVAHESDEPISLEIEAADSVPTNDNAAVTTQSREETQSVENPFDEPFEEEELLIDQFLPKVAEQNRSSLLVTASDLDSISPLKRHISLAELQADLLGENSVTPDEAALANNLENDSAEPIRPPQLTERRPEETVPCEMLSAAKQQETDPHRITDDFPSTPYTLSQTNQGHLENDANESKSKPVAADVLSPDFVEKRKAEILLSLNEGETAEPDPTEQKIAESDVPFREPSYQDVVQAIEGRRNDMSMENVIPVMASDEGDVVDNADADSILWELQNQHRELNEVITFDSEDQQAANDEQPSSLAIEYPVVEHEDYQSDHEAGLPGDDRDMIIISRADRLSSPEPMEETPDDLMPQQASTGRAERMEYQKLFDQLRNVPKED